MIKNFDYAATHPIHPVFMKALNEVCDRDYGNMSSNHQLGFNTEIMFNECKNKIKDLYNIPNDYDILFTSGATESINTVFHALDSAITQFRVENTVHKAVLNQIEVLNNINMKVLPHEQLGFSVINTYDRFVIFTTSVNNETGNVSDIEDIKIPDDRPVYWICDHTQGFTKHFLDYSKYDGVIISGHKIGTLAGLGMLVVSPRLKQWIQANPLIIGAGQQDDMRGGTVRIEQIYAITKLLEYYDELPRLDVYHVVEEELKRLSNMLMIPLTIHTRNPGYIISAAFTGISSEDLLSKLSDVAISTGSACTSKDLRLSHVLEAEGVPPEIAECTFRISWGLETTAQELVDFIRSDLYDAVKKVAECTLISSKGLCS